MAGRVDLDGNPIKQITICMIGAGGFIGSHLCEKLLSETPHKVLAVDVYSDKIKHLLEPATVTWADRIQFHRINIKNDSRLEGLIKMADLTINLAAICTPADYNTRPLDTIYSNFIDALPVVKYCSENGKRLIHFSTCEVYGKTIGAFLPKDSPLRQDPAYYVLKEDTSPCIFGPIEKQRWSYACAKQLIERLVYAEGAENGLEFTIVRPFNWIGPRMDFIPGIDGPSEGVPRVLACFSNNLLRREPLKLVDGGESQRTFIYIKDAIEAVLLMIENPARANGHIFNVGNPNNEVTVRQLAEMMTKVYAKVSGESSIETPTIDVSSKEFYGEGYDDSDKRIPDMTIINRQLGWNPKTSLWDLLESTLTYQHRTYAESEKRHKRQVILRPCSKVIIKFLTVMMKHGYIGEFEIVDDHRSGKIVVNLNGRLNKCGVISPRFDCPLRDIETWTKNLLPSRQFGYVVLTTSHGILDHEEARRKHTGGKVLGFFF